MENNIYSGPGAEDLKRILANAPVHPPAHPSYPDGVFVKPKPLNLPKSSKATIPSRGGMAGKFAKQELEADEKAYQKEMANKSQSDEDKPKPIAIALSNLHWDREQGYFNKTAVLCLKAEIPPGDFQTYHVVVKLFGKCSNGKTEQISNQLLPVDMKGNASKEIYLFYPKEKVDGASPKEGVYYFTAQLGSGEEEKSPVLKVIAGICTDMAPPAPSEKLGTCPYYPWRHQNFISRHMECNRKPPEYYLSYGYKYCVKFSKETAPILSAKGKIWLGRARYKLQIAIENKLKNAPNIELDADKFADFAFETHTDAYWDAGLSEVDLLDLIHIGFTPDFSEWIDERSRVQAYDIAGKLVVHWTSDVVEAVKRRSEEAGEYFRDILK